MSISCFRWSRWWWFGWGKCEIMRADLENFVFSRALLQSLATRPLLQWCAALYILSGSIRYIWEPCSDQYNIKCVLKCVSSSYLFRWLSGFAFNRAGDQQPLFSRWSIGLFFLEVYVTNESHSVIDTTSSVCLNVFRRATYADDWFVQENYCINHHTWTRIRSCSQLSGNHRLEIPIDMWVLKAAVNSFR